MFSNVRWRYQVMKDHSKVTKMYFCDLWMILHDLVMLPKVGRHLVLSQYAISSRPSRPNYRKWPKTSFLALWIIQKCIFWVLNDPAWPGNVVKCWKTLSTVTVCIIKSIQQTKVQKMTKNLFFGSLDHSKMHLCDL